jgi:hypothetical protein
MFEFSPDQLPRATPRFWPNNTSGQAMTIAELMGEAAQTPVQRSVLPIARRTYVWVMQAASSQQVCVAGR